MVSDLDWARAFARQAIADLETREFLVSARAPKCHRLHYLQMAVEKTCKAYLIAVNGRDGVRNTHHYISKNLPVMARQFFTREFPMLRLRSDQFDRIRKLAVQMELLSPACDESGSRPDNCEYPWESTANSVLVPVNFNFQTIDEGSKEFGLIIRLVRAAARSYSAP